MIVTRSQSVQRLIVRARRVACTPSNVLLLGETGTGKRSFAAEIAKHAPHEWSQTSWLDCAALGDLDLRSQLGWPPMALGRSSNVPRAETSAGCILVLHEITRLTDCQQAELLHLIDGDARRTISPPSERRLRVIATSSEDVTGLLRTNGIHNELYHRLSTFTLRVPALKDRREDISLLALHFAKAIRHHPEALVPSFSTDAMKALTEYHWPGNVTQLKKVVERGCILSDAPQIESNCLELDSEPTMPANETNDMPESWLEKDLAQIEREVILAALARFGNQRIAAEKLGVSTRTLSNKMRQYRDQLPCVPEQRRAA